MPIDRHIQRFCCFREVLYILEFFLAVRHKLPDPSNCQESPIKGEIEGSASILIVRGIEAYPVIIIFDVAGVIAFERFNNLLWSVLFS